MGRHYGLKIMAYRKMKHFYVLTFRFSKIYNLLQYDRVPTFIEAHLTAHTENETTPAVVVYKTMANTVGT